jgi:predicted nuclease with RNAse H fold
MNEWSGVWCGVDVGGRRKGFHVAVVDAVRVLQAPSTGLDVAAAVEYIGRFSPVLTAVDSPICAAPAGHSSRTGERRVLPEVGCNIRPTPDLDTIRQRPDDLYGWITHGFELYEALRQAGLEVVECFPTASWTRWGGRRGAQTRASWSRRALAATGLTNVPERTNQDQRDAIAAALTARAHSRSITESLGEIVVPLPPAEAVG